MSDQTDTEPAEYFIRRTYDGDVTSCGGPFATRQEAHRAARRFRPANGRSVDIWERRLDPEVRPGRHLVLRLRRTDGPPGRQILVGPFQSRREARNFLRQAFEPQWEGGVDRSTLGSMKREWEPVEANRTSELDAPDAWYPEPKLAI